MTHIVVARVSLNTRERANKKTRKTNRNGSRRKVDAVLLHFCVILRRVCASQAFELPRQSITASVAVSHPSAPVNAPQTLGRLPSNYSHIRGDTFECKRSICGRSIPRRNPGRFFPRQARSRSPPPAHLPSRRSCNAESFPGGSSFAFVFSFICSSGLAIHFYLSRDPTSELRRKSRAVGKLHGDGDRRLAARVLGGGGASESHLNCDARRLRLQWHTARMTSAC